MIKAKNTGIWTKFAATLGTHSLTLFIYLIVIVAQLNIKGFVNKQKRVKPLVFLRPPIGSVGSPAISMRYAAAKALIKII